MHSVLIAYIIGFFNAFFRIFKKSAVYRIFDKVYSVISSSWKNSVIMQKIKACGQHDVQKQSVLYKIVHLPFLVLENISEKAGDFFSSAYENSVILKNLYAFLDNALSLNTKFYALILVGIALSRQLFAFSFSAKMSALLLLGIAILFTDYNVTDFFEESKTVKFLLALLGFSDISFDIYDKTNLKKRSALFFAFVVGIVSGILLKKSYIFAIIPFFAIVLAALVLKYPIAGIFFSAFSAPFVPTMLLAALVLYTEFCFCFYTVRTKDFKWKIDSIGTGLGFFLIFMFISSIFSFSAKKSILVWGLYLIFIGYYFTITNAVKTKKQLYSIIRLFVIAGFFVSIYGIAQYVFGWDTQNAWIDEEMFENATMRAYSTMGNPNVLGEYLLLLIPLCMFLFIKSSAKTLQKWFWLVAAGAGTLCMVLTQSRGCWIGLFLAAAIFVTFYNGKLWGLLPFLLLALPFVLPQTMIDRFLSVGNLEDSSTSYRVFIWLGTISMLRDFWIGGIGMGEGAFRTVYPFYSYNSIIAPHSHNLYLQLLVEGGISALIIFLVTIIIYIKKTSEIFSGRGKESIDGVFALATVSAVCGFLVQSMFDYTFYNYRMMSMFFIMLALSSCLFNFKEVEDAESY